MARPGDEACNSVYPVTSDRFFHQITLIQQCTLKKKLNEDVFIIYEHVPTNSNHHMKESITRVHVVNLKGFLFRDDPKNVVPTCTCPSNRNLKDCCAGIMFALSQRSEFSAWYGQGFTFHQELLDRRLRADLDPVSVHFDMLSNQFTTDYFFYLSV